jgi:DNA-directed RNA polymerase specialized sigma subunit
VAHAPNVPGAAAGHRAATYARPCVTGELKRYFHDKRWPVHVKRSVQHLTLYLRSQGGQRNRQEYRTGPSVTFADDAQLPQ